MLVTAHEFDGTNQQQISGFIWNTLVRKRIPTENSRWFAGNFLATKKMKLN